MKEEYEGESDKERMQVATRSKFEQEGLALGMSAYIPFHVDSTC